MGRVYDSIQDADQFEFFQVHIEVTYNKTERLSELYQLFNVPETPDYRVPENVKKDREPIERKKVVRTWKQLELMKQKC